MSGLRNGGSLLESVEPDVKTADVTPWYGALNRDQWYALFAASLGWVFDGYETYALILTMPSAFHQLLEPERYAAIPFYTGLTVALTLLGWGIGGIVVISMSILRAWGYSLDSGDRNP